MKRYFVFNRSDITRFVLLITNIPAPSLSKTTTVVNGDANRSFVGSPSFCTTARKTKAPALSDIESPLWKTRANIAYSLRRPLMQALYRWSLTTARLLEADETDFSGPRVDCNSVGQEAERNRSAVCASQFQTRWPLGTAQRYILPCFFV